MTVSLDKAMSYRYSVIGDVGQPGIRLMSKRITVSEAIAEAGGVLNTGKKSGIRVLRRNEATGKLDQIAVNLSEIYKGKAPDNVYLEPGDQIVVPGNTLKKIQTIMSLTPIASFRSHLRRASAVSICSNAHSARIIPGSVTRRRDHVCPDRHVGAPE